MTTQIVAAETFLAGLLGPALTAAGLTYTNAAGTVRPRLFSNLAEAGVPEPYVVMQNMSTGTIRRVMNGNSIWADLEYIVKAVARSRTWAGVNSGQVLSLDAIAVLIDATLHNTSGTAGGRTIVECRQLREYLFQETPDALTYRHLGSRVQLLVS